MGDGWVFWLKKRKGARAVAELGGERGKREREEEGGEEKIFRLGGESR